VAALIGLRDFVAYEGQAAIELEMLQGREAESPYPSEIVEEKGVFQIRLQPIIQGVVQDVLNNNSAGSISRRFHLTLMEVLTQICKKIRDDSGLEKVVMAGGVFQNRTLLSGMEERLQKEGFQVYSKALVPSNDGGIALGQAVAAHYMNQKKEKEWGSRGK
jgi:hydrogenase maturation protein HypF